MKGLTRAIVFGICVVFIIVGCKGDTGPAGPSGVVIYSITATPPVVRPEESTVLKVSAGDGAGSALTYAWEANEGSLSAVDTNPVTWTAPGTTGSYMVSVEVSNGKGSTVTAYASILVSVSPAGPIVTSVNPVEAKVGEEIRVTGAGFGALQGTSGVKVGGILTTTVVSWSDTVIRLKVPAGAVTGGVTVVVAGTESSPGYLIVLWTLENPVNVAIRVATNGQNNLQIVSDGSGGAIITWEDYRIGTVGIYAQRVNSSGIVQWTANGETVCPVLNNRYNPQLVGDGSCGAIITWEEYRGYSEVIAQRVNSYGVIQWASGGVEVCTTGTASPSPQIASDGSGGAIITWEDFRNGNFDIYAQRLNNAGAPQWTADGVSVCTAAIIQGNPQIVSDGFGGAIITWEDFRNGNNDIYAQRLNNAGAPQWTADGVSVCTASDYQGNLQIVSDGYGGAIITWEDDRNGNTDIYAQRINIEGTPLWTSDGVSVCTATDLQRNSQLISDGSGGAIITWEDIRNSPKGDIYAQRVNSSGAMQWTIDGIAVCTAGYYLQYPQIISDGSGGAIITWQDDRSGNYDIYTQRINSAGIPEWSMPVCTAAYGQYLPQLVSDGYGGAIITWGDLRNGNGDIYAQGVSASGRQ